MAKKNLCGIEIEYAEDKEFHKGMFHCYGPHTIDGEKVEGVKQNFVTIENNDGTRVKVFAMCPSFDDAKAVVCAMGIAKKLKELDDKLRVDAKSASIKDVLKCTRSEIDDKLRKDGYNIEAMEAKMDELLKSGKSSEDIIKYMNEHREDFIVKKPDSKPTDDSKERW